MSHTEQEWYKNKIKDNDKKIKNERDKIAKLTLTKSYTNHNQKQLTKKNKIKEEYEQEINAIKNELLTLENENFKEKDTIKLETDKQEEIENEIAKLETDKQEIRIKIENLDKNKQEIENQLKINENNKEYLKNEIAKLEDNVDNFNLIIKEKEVEIAKLRLSGVQLLINLQEEIKEITELKLKESNIEQTIAEKEKQLREKNDQTYSNKKTKKELKMAKLNIKLKQNIYEMYELYLKISILCINNAKVDKEILKSYLTISKLEKFSSEITEKKITMTNSIEDNVNSNQQNVTSQIKRIGKRFTTFLKIKTKKFTLTQYQNQEKKVEEEISKLEAEKLKGFWNKFWLFISCGCYNNHGKKEWKIEERREKLKEIRKKIEKLSKTKILNNEPQLSTSSTSTKQDESWSDKVLKSIETGNFPTEKSKNLFKPFRK